MDISMQDTKLTSEMEITSIRISMRLRSALLKLGKKGDSYEDIIWRLLKNG